MASTDKPAQTRGDVQGAISNAVVGLMHDYTGRGPTRARTTIVDDLVVVVLRDALLKAEQTLVDGGQSQMVLELRRAFQGAMKDDLTATIASLTGRKVIAFMSANHVDPDMAVEIFMLEPPSRDGHGPDAPAITD